MDEADGQSLTAARAAIRELPPAAFAFVMATGIISESAADLGPSWLSRALLVVTSAGFVLLSAALVIRLAVYRAALAADVRAPERVFGFFTVVAASNVLGSRLVTAGHPVATAVLAGLAAAAWLLLSYGVPVVLLARDRDSVLGAVSGAWLLWAVGTQSLSVAASDLVPAWPSQARLLAGAAVALWSVGVVLYLLLVALILVRWLAVPVTPAALGAPYWILMGGAAISVLAGARILSLPGRLPVVRATSGFVQGTSFALWALGTWWIPLLIVLGVWRHVWKRWPLRYEADLWGAVFPLGMYSAATFAFGAVAGLGFFAPISRVMLWVAVTAWVAVAAAFGRRVAFAS